MSDFCSIMGIGFIWDWAQIEMDNARQMPVQQYFPDICLILNTLKQNKYRKFGIFVKQYTHFMKPLLRTTSLILYLAGLSLIATALLFRQETLFTLIGMASMILMIPWIICIADSFKRKNNSNGLWTYLLIFFGLVFIPVYLLYKHSYKIK